MSLHSVKITIAADNTPQAVTTTDLANASPAISVSKSKASIIIIASEAGNDGTATSRVGGPEVTRNSSIGLPILPTQSVTLPAGGADTRNPYDVKNVYVSGKQNDVFNYTWLVG